jgi:DNA-binding transcriptional ArsR family regulator
MKTMKTISDPEGFKLFADETRRKIVFILRAKEMTVSQIAEEFNLTPQAVYHHIKKLVEGEMIEVTREVRVDHIIESYYRATAEAFQFVLGKTSHSKEAQKEQITTALNALKRIGFKIEVDENTISKLAELKAEIDECCELAKEDALDKLDDIDPLTIMTAKEFVGILSMSEEELAEQQKIQKKFRNMLKSLVKNSPRA